MSVPKAVLETIEREIASHYESISELQKFLKANGVVEAKTPAAKADHSKKIKEGIAKKKAAAAAAAAEGGQPPAGADATPSASGPVAVPANPVTEKLKAATKSKPGISLAPSAATPQEASEGVSQG